MSVGLNICNAVARLSPRGGNIDCLLFYMTVGGSDMFFQGLQWNALHHMVQRDRARHSGARGLKKRGGGQKKESGKGYV